MNHSISREVPISLIIIVCESIPEVSLEKPRLRIDKNKIYFYLFRHLGEARVFFFPTIILKILISSVLQLLQPRAWRARLFPRSVERDCIGI